ncbi:MAG: NADH dehydrogenase (ubiquinone), 30 kDa subunit [uncultured bacterium]|nr:MAG: NADH dehydrogenase (ubiquinone), 30 kDa subunit [uncultured bacterium]
MIEEQKTTKIEISALQNEVRKLFDENYRLVQIGCTKTSEGIEINYSFDKNFQFQNFRILVTTPETEVPSITDIYLAAFIYENEIHDLFGIKVIGNKIDFKGNFYRTSIKTPFIQETSKDERK